MFVKIRRYLSYGSLYYSIGMFLTEYLPWIMSDKYFIKCLFLRIVGRKLDLKHPKTFVEKMNWLKVYDHNPLYTKLVDKCEVKQYVAEKIGSEYVNPTIAEFNSINDINVSEFHDGFVIKCNHDSGSTIVCNSPSDLDEESLNFLKWKLSHNHYWRAGEWPYKNVKRKILVEPLLKECGEKALMDYKFFCFGGEPKILYMSRDSSRHPTTDFFDMDFQPLPIRLKDPPSDALPLCPPEFEKMKSLAKTLSDGIPLVRVDFYVVNHHIFFGEMTFFHNGGFTPFTPSDWEKCIGSWINLNS